MGQMYVITNTSDSDINNPWDLDLLAPELRGEFAEYFERKKEQVGAVTGGSRQLLESEELRKFMNKKKINIVHNPARDTLESRFILKSGEKVLMDERGANSMRRYEKRKVKTSDGSSTSELGFVTIKKASEMIKKEMDKSKEKSEFKCDLCGKVLPNKGLLVRHLNLHEKDRRSKQKKNTNKRIS